jgi:predicted Zn-dependent peptidase
MDNGIHFFCIEDHELPLIKMILKVRTGKVEVAKGKEGLARILAQVMQTGGTANYPEQKFDQLLENRAARFNINMGFDSCTVSLNVMKDDFAFLLPKIVHLLTTPLLPEQKILLAKQMLRTEISRRGEDQATMGIRELKRLIYGPDSVYARLPEYDSVAAVTKRDLQAFHARAFQAPNIQIGLVGDFATEKMQEQLIQAFSHFPGGAEKNTLNFPEIQGSRAQDIQLLSKQNVNQSFVILGHLGSYRDTPDYATLQVMNQIISGGFSGRLFQRVRTQRGLAYSVYGRYGCHYYYPGIFYVALQTKSETTAKAIEVIKRELSKLQKQGVTQDELDQAREQFLNSLIFQYDNPLEILKRRLYYEYRGMDKDSFEKLVQEIQKVSVKDINEVTKKYLGLEDLQVVVVGNKAEVYEQLQALGSVRVTE